MLGHRQRFMCLRLKVGGKVSGVVRIGTLTLISVYGLMESHSGRLRIGLTVVSEFHDCY